jgi:hypothetical protein
VLKGYCLLENALLSAAVADKFSYSQEGSSGFAGANRKVLRRMENVTNSICVYRILTSLLLLERALFYVFGGFQHKTGR